jgi:hypothetical protein
VKWSLKSVFGILLLGTVMAITAFAVAGGYSGCLSACNPLPWGYGLFRPAN